MIPAGIWNRTSMNVRDGVYKKGQGCFEIAGYPAEIGPNDIIIIKPNQPHKFIVKSESGCEFIVLSFKFVNRFDGQYSMCPLKTFWTL